MAILVVGSVAFDTIKTPFGKVEKALGGSAVHFSSAASKLSKVHLVGVVGEDFGNDEMLFLQERGINIDALKKKPGRTFFWEGYYEYDMNQAHTVTTELNVFKTFNPVIPEDKKEISYVFLANIDPDIQLKLTQQIKTPKLIVCDTMNFWIENKKEQFLEVLKRVDIILLNDSEARQLMKTSNLLKAARQIISLGVSTVIIKKGEHGAIMITKDSLFVAPAFPMEEIIDPTGAGDSFAGGFLSFIDKKDKVNENVLRQAVIYATVIASFNVQDFGTKGLANITYIDIKARYKKLHSISQFKSL